MIDHLEKGGGLLKKGGIRGGGGVRESEGPPYHLLDKLFFIVL